MQQLTLNQKSQIQNIEGVDKFTKKYPLEKATELGNTLIMCSCTHSGSLLPRMLSSSSSDMKKKRGKALRLESR